MRWQFAPDEAFAQHVLPDPCVQIVVGPAGATVMGVVTRRFSVVLTGARFVLGLKFRPGGFRPFVPAAVSTFTNRSAPLRDVFPRADDEHQRALACRGDGRGVVDVLESLLCACDPAPDPRLDEVYAIVDRIATDGTLLTVERATRELGTSRRSLQRLLKTYVGVTPKWLIRLYRLKEAAARIEAGEVDDWADLALRLGYADQAHFVNDFRRLVGQSPARYAQSVGKG
jgi:AraC-like DNA-binding protein